MENRYEEFDVLVLNARYDEYKRVELVNRLSPLIKSSIKKFCPLYMYFEDLYSDGVLIVLECLEFFDSSKGNFLAMVKSYLKYHYIETLKYLKSLSAEVAYGGGDEKELIDLIPSNENIEGDLICIDERIRLKKTLEILAKRQKQVVEMYYFKNMSHEDIAKELNISKWTVINSKRRALEKLREVV